MKVKKICFGFLMFFMMTLFVACSQKTEDLPPVNQQEKEETGKTAVQIGLSLDSFVIERWMRDRDVFIAEAKELGAEVNVQDAGGSVEEQISQIEYFIKKQMDVIVVVACDCEALSEVLTKARDAGIKTISYDRLNLRAQSDLYVSFDNKKVGELMAKALIEGIPEGGNVFMIQGSAEDNNVHLVREGFDEIIKNTNLNIVYEAFCDGWKAEEAIAYLESALAQYPDVDGIMCGNDDIASQVIQVLAEYKMAGDVVVVAQDGDLAACQRIVEGTQYMTAFKAVDELARDAAHYAVALGLGEEIEGLTGMTDDGYGEVPSKILDPVAVTKDNIDSVIVNGGFHRKEDIYLNVAENKK